MESKVLTTLLARNRKFYIIKFKGYYCAVEDKYLDENMCLTQTLNGLQMHAMKEMSECIKSAKMSADVDYFMSQGHEFNEAFNMASALC